MEAPAKVVEIPVALVAKVVVALVAKVAEVTMAVVPVVRARRHQAQGGRLFTA